MTDLKPSLVSINKLVENPWHFRMMSEKDFENMVEEIQNNGFDSVAYPVISKLDKKFFIVDGHSRISAAQKVGLKKIPCIITNSISDHHQLRIKTFHLNREGCSNPLLLSDMISEDMHILNDIQQVASAYKVDEDYVSSLLKISTLHDDTKSVIQKIINVAKRKYQFLLNQLTPSHLAGLANLSHEKQIEIVDWIFRDIMYGPSDESMVSIPSVYEIIDEIEKISENKEKRTYKKSDDVKYKKNKDFALTCVCGAKYNIDTKSSTVYEYIEQNNVIIKKEFSEDKLSTKSFSSKNHAKSELIDAINNSHNCEVKVIITKRE